MGRDYYQLLGVGRTANDAELKKGDLGLTAVCSGISMVESSALTRRVLGCTAYRKLAMTHHPVSCFVASQLPTSQMRVLGGRPGAPINARLGHWVALHIPHGRRTRTQTIVKLRQRSSKPYPKPMRWQPCTALHLQHVLLILAIALALANPQSAGAIRSPETASV